MPTPYLSIVVPTYNGADWIADTLAELEQFVLAQSVRVQLVLVDDGSGPVTTQILRDFAMSRRWVTLLRNEQNRGKGFAVARGMRAARGAYRIFTDADLAYPASQISRLLTLMEEGVDVAIANRVHPDSRFTMNPSCLRYHVTRHFLSRTLNLAVRSTVIPGVHDTQAGLKGFTAKAADTIFPKLTVDRFGFDIEALLAARLHGFLIAESPVCYRYEIDASTVRFTRDILRMTRDLFRIASNALRGKYSPSNPPRLVMSPVRHGQVDDVRPAYRRVVAPIASAVATG